MPGLQNNRDACQASLRCQMITHTDCSSEKKSQTLKDVPILLTSAHIPKQELEKLFQIIEKWVAEQHSSGRTPTPLA